MVFSVTLHFSPDQWKRIKAYYMGEARKLNITLEQALQLAVLAYIESSQFDEEALGLIKLYMSIHNLVHEKEVINTLVKAGFRALEGKPLTES